MDKITVQKRARAKFVRLRLSPQVQHALKGIRKLYFKGHRINDEVAAGCTLIWALSHWSRRIDRQIVADRMYMWREGIEDDADFYERKLMALWK